MQVMDQPQYNMLVRDRVEREYLPVCRESGYGLTTWSPLATGILTGRLNMARLVRRVAGKICKSIIL